MTDIIGDRILLQGWVIYPDGEKLMATSPSGKKLQFEMIDITDVIGVQPATPPDYVPPPDVFTTLQAYQNKPISV